jgi:hypothetical protein
MPMPKTPFTAHILPTNVISCVRIHTGFHNSDVILNPTQHTHPLGALAIHSLNHAYSYFLAGLPFCACAHSVRSGIFSNHPSSRLTVPTLK